MAAANQVRRYGFHGTSHAYVSRARLSVALRQRLKKSERLHQLYTSGAFRGRKTSSTTPAEDEGRAAA